MSSHTSIDTRWRQFYRYDLPVIAYAGLIYWFSSRPYTEIEKKLVKSVPDLIPHAIEYGILAYLLFRSLSHPSRNPALWRAGILTFLIAAVYGALDEWHQSFVPGRQMDIRDWIADASGALIVTLVCYQNSKKKLTPD